MTVTIKDLSRNEELDRAAMAAAQGGRQRLPGQHADSSQLLTTPDGEPLPVHVDGVRVNSVTTGYAPK
jgi:hypothetical protein